MQNQKKVWNNIAEEWNKFKTEPARHTLEFLKNKQGKILDLGSGSGRHLQDIKNGKMYLVDFSEKMIELAKKKSEKENIDAEFIVSELDSLPFPDNYFDYAISNAAIHCLETPEKREKAVKELYRVMKKKAQAEISVWNKDTKRFEKSSKDKLIAWREKGKRYYYLYSPDEIYKLFEKNNFRIINKENPPARNIVFIVEKR